MAIKDPLMFITIEEFKNWKGFNKLEFDDTTTPDNEIWFAISIATNNIDYLSGFEISKKWPETILTEFTNVVQTATAYYVRFLLTKDSNYIRGQSSISQGGMTYSENNPNDPYFIVPEVFNCLRKIKEYPNITGFNLDVLPKRNDFFSNFYSNFGEDSPLTRYIECINLKSKDPRTKITLENPKNLIGTEVWIDATGIKTDIGSSLWEVDKDNPNFIFPKDFKGISANDKRIIDVGTPTFLTDATNKEYVDELLDKKQDKLTFNNQFKNENNTISLDTEIVFNKLDIPNVNTTSKTVNGAINENKNNIDKKQDKINDLENKIFKDKEQKENFIELLTNAFYLANSLFDENEFYGTNTKELGNKIHLNTDGIVTIDLLHN
ncbi:hypothetical protein [Spiroplasma endosymbiont of Notiophilus biguttatus]|uniref:hypothetical protein n=1 Tax=Spiroplasma endosymbiont of Notiophilus biguttatus TaxID=3066285 RepID=UPI00313F060D